MNMNNKFVFRFPFAERGVCFILRYELMDMINLF